MAIQIFSVSSCVNKDKDWHLVINHHDLKNKKEPLRKLSPLPKIPGIIIGAGINVDGTIVEPLGKSTQIAFSDFSNGKIISVEELPNKLYLFDAPKEVMNDTKLYIINNGSSKPFVFFCYELFRTFLCFENKIVPYLLQYDVLESFIDKSEIREVGNKRILYLELNNNFPKLLLKNEKIRSYILVLYNKTIRAYWKSIQANATILKSDFSFNSIGFGDLELVCRVKEYKDFTLIYYIEEILSELELPFDELELVHASFRDINKKNQTNGERKKGRYAIKMPTSHSTDDDGNETDSSGYSESISVLPLHLKFDRRMKIKRLNLSAGTNSSKSDPNSKHSFQELKLGDIKVGFNDKENKGKEESIFFNITRDEGFNKFDYAEIPEGLVFFTKAVGLIIKVLKLNYTYEIKQFSNKSSFSKIGDTARKALIIKIQHNPSVYIVEIDSSDNKFISTLMFTNLNVSDENIDVFFKNVLILTGDRNGVWPDGYINDYCDFRTIRHPKVTKKLKRLSEEERNDIYIKILSNKIIGILG